MLITANLQVIIMMMNFNMDTEIEFIQYLVNNVLEKMEEDCEIFYEDYDMMDYDSEGHSICEVVSKLESIDVISFETNDKDNNLLIRFNENNEIHLQTVDDFMFEFTHRMKKFFESDKRLAIKVEGE